MGLPWKRILPKVLSMRPAVLFTVVDFLHGGGLYGAVGAEVAGDLTETNREADITHCGDTEEVVGERSWSNKGRGAHSQ